MATVTFSSSVGGNNSTVTDDSNPTTGLGNGGHRTRLVPALAQVVAVAGSAVASATAAQNSASASAATAVNCTSVDSLNLANSGEVTFNTQSNKPIVKGMYMRATYVQAGTPPTIHWMSGFVSSYSGTSLIIKMDARSGVAGPFNDWTISASAVGAGTGTTPTSRLISTAGIATGGGDLTGDRTITVAKATAAEIMTGTADDRAVTPKGLADSSAIGLETDGASIIPNFTGTFSRKVTLAGSRAIGTPVGYKEGMTYALSLIQDGTGGRTVTWGSAYDWGLAGTPALNGLPGRRDIVFLYCYDGSGTPKFACSIWKASIT